MGYLIEDSYGMQTESNDIEEIEEAIIQGRLCEDDGFAITKVSSGLEQTKKILNKWQEKGTKCIRCKKVLVLK